MGRRAFLYMSRCIRDEGTEGGFRRSCLSSSAFRWAAHVWHDACSAGGRKNGPRIAGTAGGVRIVVRRARGATRFVDVSGLRPRCLCAHAALFHELCFQLVYSVFEARSVRVRSLAPSTPKGRLAGLFRRNDAIWGTRFVRYAQYEASTSSSFWRTDRFPLPVRLRRRFPVSRLGFRPFVLHRVPSDGIREIAAKNRTCDARMGRRGGIARSKTRTPRAKPQVAVGRMWGAAAAWAQTCITTWIFCSYLGLGFRRESQGR